MHTLKLFVLLLLCTTLGCASAQPQKDIAKIKVTQTGTIELNANPVAIEELGQALARLKNNPKSIVWYYRESPEKQPSEQARAVFNTILEAGIPICLFENDFETQKGSDAFQCLAPLTSK